MATRYDYPREAAYYPPPRRAATAPSSRYSFDYAPTRSSRSNYAPSSYHDDEDDEYYAPPRRSRTQRDHGAGEYGHHNDGDYTRSGHDHASCEGGTCKAIEKEYGGFGWTEAVSLAVMGGLALFNFDKAYDKHRKKSEQRERDRQLDESKSRRAKGRRSGSSRARSKSAGRSGMRDYDSELDSDVERERRKGERERRRARSRGSRQRGYRGEEKDDRR